MLVLLLLGTEGTSISSSSSRLPVNALVSLMLNLQHRHDGCSERDC